MPPGRREAWRLDRLPAIQPRGQLIDWIHEAGRDHAAGKTIGVVFNAGAYTHTSIALHDAIKGANVPVIELHISNVHSREPFRHHSRLSPVARGVMAGFGVQGYALAIAGLVLPRGLAVAAAGKVACRKLVAGGGICCRNSGDASSATLL